MPDGTVFAEIANAHNYIQGNGGAETTLIDNHARFAETIARSGPYAGCGTPTVNTGATHGARIFRAAARVRMTGPR